MAVKAGTPSAVGGTSHRRVQLAAWGGGVLPDSLREPEPLAYHIRRVRAIARERAEYSGVPPDAL